MHTGSRHHQLQESRVKTQHSDKTRQDLVPVVGTIAGVATCDCDSVGPLWAALPTTRPLLMCLTSFRASYLQICIGAAALAHTNTMAKALYKAATLFAVLGSGSWLVVSALFNQLVLMLPDFEPSQRSYIFSLMNVAVQASKLPALVYASRKLTVSTQVFNILCS